MQLIGAGLGGTGTLQAKDTLEALGVGPCYHVGEVQEHPEQIGLWQRVAGGDRSAWTELFAGYASCVDFPSCAAYAELMDVYPDAKVLLTVRDPEQAYERVRETIYGLTSSPESPLPAPLRDVFDRLVWQGVFDGAFEDRDAALEVYRRWDAEVEARVPEERLLVYDVDDGPEPLARFLGRATASEPAR